jgi:hypothetical protein
MMRWMDGVDGMCRPRFVFDAAMSEQLIADLLF